MFAVLQVQENELNIKAKMRDIFYPPVVETQKVKLSNSKYFFKVTAKKYRGIIPWHTISATLEGLKVPVIVPKNLQEPQDVKIRHFCSKVLKTRLLFNSSLSVIETMALSPSEVYACVVDENAYIVDLVQKLVPHVAGLKIVTSCQVEYEALAESIMENFGLSVEITNKVDEKIMSSTIIISSSSSAIPLAFSGLLFTNEKRSLMNSAVLVGEGVSGCKQWLELCEGDFDKLDFCAGLYELCAVDEIGYASYQKMVSGIN